MTSAKQNKENIAEQAESIECFVIMPISNQQGYDAGHFQLVYEDIIAPAILKAKMTPKRADNAKNTNLIQLDIISNIINSPIAVCDMSAKNPNVFYELGMRQAFDKPTVLLRDELTEPPFDINGLRYVSYSSSMSHRSVVKAVEELSSAIRETYQKKDSKAEVNSMIRLLELTAAVIAPENVSDVEKQEFHNNILMNDLIEKVNLLAEKQEESMQLVLNQATYNRNQSGYVPPPSPNIIRPSSRSMPQSPSWNIPPPQPQSWSPPPPPPPQPQAWSPPPPPPPPSQTWSPPPSTDGKKRS